MKVSGAAALCAAYDRLDRANGDRVGGGFPCVNAALEVVAGRIDATANDDANVLAWKVRRLARAITCDWTLEEIERAARAVTGDEK